MPDASVELVYCGPLIRGGTGASSQTAGNPQAYYEFCRLRIVEIHPNTGTLYWRCDPNTSHYIKVMLDGIFGLGTTSCACYIAVSNNSTRMTFARI